MCRGQVGHLLLRIDEGGFVATWEPEATRSMSAGRIRKPMFATARRGYNRVQVLEHLGRVADHVEVLESRIRQLETELLDARRQSEATPRDRPPGAPDPYEAVSAQVAGLMQTFDEHVETLRREANRFLAEARAEANRILVEAQGQADEMRAVAERTLRDAHQKAERDVAGLTSGREALLKELRAMREKALDSAEGLKAVIEADQTDDHVAIVEYSDDGEADAASIE